MKVSLLFLSLVLIACGKAPDDGVVATKTDTGTTTSRPLGPAPAQPPTGPVYTQQYEVTWTVSVAPGAFIGSTSLTLTAPRQYTMPPLNQIVDGLAVTPGEVARVTLTLGDNVRCTYIKNAGQPPYSYDSGQCPAAGTTIDLPVGARVIYDLFDNNNTQTRTVSSHTTYLE